MTMKELVPVNQNVILDLTNNKEELRTASGIIIPDSAKEKPQWAKVVAVGNIDGAEIAVGDTVVFKQYSGNEVELDGKTYLLIPYSEILAKIVETEAL
ncbi:MAG TPA: co-chaperone GroES [Williamwhitmania sp.]|nr:co-chaperone GroES [Williamwhitmania sp.]